MFSEAFTVNTVLITLLNLLHGYVPNISISVLNGNLLTPHLSNWNKNYHRIVNKWNVYFLGIPIMYVADLQ